MIFDRCYFYGNTVQNDNNNNNTLSSGSAIDAMANVIVRNSLFVDNHFVGNGGNNDYQMRSVIRLQPEYNDPNGGDRISGRALLINNTFYDKKY